MNNNPGGPNEFLQGMSGMPMNPALVNYGVEATSNLLKTQRDLYMPGVSNFWNSLKIYFMVRERQPDRDRDRERLTKFDDDF